jgi:hypothetical protein
MSSDAAAAALVWGAILLIFVVIVGVSMYQNRPGAPRRPSSGPGPGAYGSIYDLLNQDKRNAIELIVEEKAEARDPEDADGNLPDLERPKPRS